MSDIIIKNIIELAFEKAKSEMANHSKTAICTHISQAFEGEVGVININYKTIERAHDKYIKGKAGGKPKNDTIDYLCLYLGYSNYADFVKQNRSLSPNNSNNRTIKSYGLIKRILAYSLAFLLLAFTIFFILYRKTTISTSQKKEITVFLNTNNERKILGKLSSKNNYTLNIWLRTGKNELYFYSNTDDVLEEYPGSEIIDVFPFWKPMKFIELSKI